MSPTIALVMIVRDESAVIERALSSVLPLIDTWRIIDTGSQDDTVERIASTLAGIPGAVRRSAWSDFATNRTELVQWAADAADWLLLLDADMTLSIDGDARDLLSGLDTDAALLEVSGGVRYRMPYLVRGGRPWRYVGRTHEYLSSDVAFRSSPFDAVRIVHHADGGSRSDKFERDLRLLGEALAEQPDDPRTTFYLAQTHRDRGELERAVELYRSRVDLGGWDEEIFYSLYQIAVLEDRLGRIEAAESFARAWDHRPTRAEPLYHLARVNRLRRRHNLSWVYSTLAVTIPQPDDLLFVEQWVYDWGATFERADAAWRIGENALAIDLAGSLLDAPALPEDHREHLRLILGETVSPR
jgi:glycosyltransferase involved in cell wall biosynthesis